MRAVRGQTQHKRPVEHGEQPDEYQNVLGDLQDFMEDDDDENRSEHSPDAGRGLEDRVPLQRPREAVPHEDEEHATVAAGEDVKKHHGEDEEEDQGAVAFPSFERHPVRVLQVVCREKIPQPVLEPKVFRELDRLRYAKHGVQKRGDRCQKADGEGGRVAHGVEDERAREGPQEQSGIEGGLEKAHADSAVVLGGHVGDVAYADYGVGAEASGEVAQDRG